MQVSWFVGVKEEGVWSVGHVGDVDVAELEVPESGNGDQEVPGQHRAHAQVAEDDAVVDEVEEVWISNILWIRFNIWIIILLYKVLRMIDFVKNGELSWHKSRFRWLSQYKKTF